MKKFITCIFACLILSTACNKQNRTETIQKKYQAKVNYAIKAINLYDKKCSYTDEGLANCFGYFLNTQKVNKNIVVLNDLSEWTFIGNGKCRSDNDCYIAINTNPNKKKKQNEIIIPINVDKQNNIKQITNSSEEKLQKQASTKTTITTSVNKKSDEEKRQIIMNYALSQEIQDVHLVIPKIYAKKCPINSQKYPACYATIINKDGNHKAYAIGTKYVDIAADREITFNLNGNCKNSSNCYAIIKSIKTGYSAKVPLKVNSNGYLATTKKYSTEEFKRICKENKK